MNKVESATSKDVSTGFDHRFNRDVFLLRQKHLSSRQRYVVTDEEGEALMFVERANRYARGALLLLAGVVFIGLVVLIGYLIGRWLTSLSGPQGSLVLYPLFLGLAAIVFAGVLCFGGAKALEPSPQIRVFADAEFRVLILEARPQRRWSFLTPQFFILHEGDELLGTMSKRHLASFVSSKWTLFDRTGELVSHLRERGWLLPQLRRASKGQMRRHFETNYVFINGYGQELGRFDRFTTRNDRHALDLTADSRVLIDRRLALGAATVIDALGDR